jgi:hypothetical protein
MFDRAHQRFLAAVVMALAGYRAVEPDPVRQQVDVFVVRIQVTREDVLVLLQAHALEVAPRYVNPLPVRQTFAWRRR